MRARNWTFICCAVASAAATGAAMAQSGSCATAPAAVVGDNVYICDGAFPNQLTQASLAGGTTTIYKAGWFSFTPASTGSYTLSVCGSNADTKMAIGTACAASATTTFNVLAYNDDSCAFTGGTGLWASRLNNSNTGIPLTTDLQAGVTYYVAIGGFGSATIPAAGTLTISAARFNSSWEQSGWISNARLNSASFPAICLVVSPRRRAANSSTSRISICPPKQPSWRVVSV